MWTKFIPIFKIYSSGNFFFWQKANDVAVMKRNKTKHKLEENIRKIFKDIFIFSIHKVCIWKYLSYYQTISVSAVLIFDPCSPLFNSKNWFWLRHDSFWMKFIFQKAIHVWIVTESMLSFGCMVNYWHH